MKKIAIKSLIVLFAVVFAALFFGKTLETLSTAKARFNRPTNGRLLSDSKLEAKVYYKQEVEVIPALVKKYPITIQSVYFEKGNSIDVGDVIFAASVNDYDKKFGELNDQLVKKNAELLDLDSKNVRFPTKSEKSDRYFALKNASEALIRAKSKYNSQARLEGKTADPKDWQKEQQEYDRAYQAFIQFARITLANDEGFDYIVKRGTLLEEIAALEADAEELALAKLTFANIKAEAAGIITDISIKPAEVYDGSKALYKYNSNENPPVLRAIIPSGDALPEVDDKATVKVEYEKVNLKVSEVGKTKDGQRFADFALSEKAITQFGGVKKMLEMEKIELVLQKRSKVNSTIIPASTLRQEGESNYVYIAEFKDNGLLGYYREVKKRTVTVLGKNDTQVAVSEEIYEDILDREDRPLAEEMRVLEIQK